MPIQCTFRLNNQETSTFFCPGFGGVAAFSGTKAGRDNPALTDKPDLGPLPAGRYYLVDRQSGGGVVL
ncbi:tlde1 domain-containing protein [Paraburkholderia caffeinilytica]|uniref:tlde1 domain-containing protein n=1 Tax=Paraburkholderia caffeinilytica TaxID=1761016 RepID=UPI003DA04515